MAKGYMYILECDDGTYYTGSTKDLNIRMKQHQDGKGANHTAKRLPVKLLYYEEYDRIDKAFYRALRGLQSTRGHVFSHHAQRRINGQHQGHVVCRQHHFGRGACGPNERHEHGGEQQGGRHVPTPPLARAQSLSYDKQR